MVENNYGKPEKASFGRPNGTADCSNDSTNFYAGTLTFSDVMSGSTKIPGQKSANPSEIADLIIQNNGFGTGQVREKIENSLGNALTKSLTCDNQADLKLVNQINEQLMQKQGLGSWINPKMELSSSGEGFYNAKLPTAKDGRFEEYGEQVQSFVFKNGNKETDLMRIKATMHMVTRDGKVLEEAGKPSNEIVRSPFISEKPPK